MRGEKLREKLGRLGVSLWLVFLTAVSALAADDTGGGEDVGGGGSWSIGGGDTTNPIEGIKKVGGLIYWGGALIALLLHLGILVGLPAIAGKVVYKQKEQRGESPGVPALVAAGVAFIGALALEVFLINPALKKIGYDLVSIVNMFKGG